MPYYNAPYNYNFGYYPQAQPLMPMGYSEQQTNLNVQPVQSNTNNSMDSYMIWVQGKAGAQSYPVARGTTLPLFDSEGDYVYIKSVDNNGIPLPLVTKVLSDPPVEIKAEVVESAPQIDMSDYITKEKYEELKKKYDALEERIFDLETKPTSSFNSTFTGNTFNNSRKGGSDDGSKFSL